MVRINGAKAQWHNGSKELVPADFADDTNLKI
jgi:hypothetical protein